MTSITSDASIPGQVAQIPILLLEEEPDPLPKWMAYYTHVSYIWFGIHITYSIFHLCFIAYILGEQLLHIQFEPVYHFLEYNSYSVLCPMLCILFVGILIYQLRLKIRLDDGDFFGFTGILLLLCIILAYDATGVYHLYSERTIFLSNKEYEKMQEDPKESNELSWQFAWSTKPTCARVHAHMNEEKNKAQKAEDEISKPVLGPKLINPFDDPEEVNSWLYTGLTKEELQAGLLVEVIEPKLTAGLEDLTADEIAYKSKSECDNSPDGASPIEQPRDWMIKMQKELKCCGPYGKDKWQPKVKDLKSCKGTEGCAKSFNEYLQSFFLSTILIMFVQDVMYVITIILACFHYAAMKYDETRTAKQYSLLNIHEETVHVIDVEEVVEPGRRRTPNLDSKTVIKTGAPKSNPVVDLFMKANHRVEKSRRSTADLHLPAALTMPHTPSHLAPSSSRVLQRHSKSNLGHITSKSRPI